MSGIDPGDRSRIGMMLSACKMLFDRLPVPRQFLCFAGVGTVGFTVDACVLTILVALVGVDRYSARVISFGVAVTVTWLLNRQFTFAVPQGAGMRPGEYSRYFGVQFVGALINFGIYGLLVASFDTAFRYPALALAVGSVTAMFFNFLGAKHFAFRTSRRTLSSIAE
ncbi:GtrA family protein [Rhodospirillaceae bacterium SYSU D60014]|uniref:GtrA family protein n=1 Tax=Virgifigura deserti TaxID=2268457 RepID=UPI000E66FB38